MPLDDTGFVYNPGPERSHPAKPAVPGLVEVTLAASACLLAWGLALALVGIGAGILAVLGVV